MSEGNMSDGTIVDNPASTPAPEAGANPNIASPAKTPPRRLSKLEKSAGRIVLIVVGFVCIYMAIMARLTQFGTAPDQT